MGLMQAAAEFGLTPSARSRIIAGNAKKEDVDEMARQLDAACRAAMAAMMEK